MKTLVLLSAFRNSARTGQITRYMQQAAALQRHLRTYSPQHWTLRIIAVHGDSTDGTEGRLIEEAGRLQLSLQLIRHDHGGPVFGSTEDPARMQALSGVVNAGMDAVRFHDDYILYVESDLLWDPETVEQLLSELRVREWSGDDDRKQQPGILAPLTFAGDAFYDIWGFRKDGERFGPLYPYHPAAQFDGLTYGMDSVGSCFAMHAAVARACRVHDDNALVGFCADVRAQGWDIAVDARLKVNHP